jgi:hypothetical protein
MTLSLKAQTIDVSTKESDRYSTMKIKRLKGLIFSTTYGVMQDVVVAKP